MAESPKKGSGTGWHRQFNQCGAGIIEVDTGSSGFTPSATNHHSIQAVRFHVKVGRSPAPDRVGYHGKPKGWRSKKEQILVKQLRK